MTKVLENNLTLILLAIIGYLFFSISSNLKESSKYDSDLRAFTKIKAFINNN